MPYRASLGGAFGSGMYFPPSQGVDVAQAIDAVTNGASSLIHGAYLRRQAAIQNQQQKARQDLEDKRYNDEQARRREVEDRDYALKVEAQRKQDLANGFTPASTDVTLTPAPASPSDPAIPTDGASAIRSAMTAGLSADTPSAAPSVPGILTPGNIDVTHRPRVKNADGSVSTVKSFSTEIDGKEVLLPLVGDDGRMRTPEEAIADYQRTGKHLGIFSSPAAATAYAQRLHEAQAAQLDGRGDGSVIAAAMTAPARSSPLTAPVDIGQLPTMNVTETPESYDPARAASVVRATETARINAERDAARNATTLAARKIMKEATIEAARIRANASKGGSGGGSGGIRGAMTAGQQERKFETVDAPGILAAHDWNLQDALDDLKNTPEGQALSQAGFTSRHLVAAYEKHVGEQTTAALRQQSSAMGATPEESTGAVQQTRDLVRKGTSGTAAPKPAAGKPTAPAGKADYDGEARQYQNAVKAITQNFSGAERERRLKLAQDRYNQRVTALAKGTQP